MIDDKSPQARGAFLKKFRQTVLRYNSEGKLTDCKIIQSAYLTRLGNNIPSFLDLGGSIPASTSMGLQGGFSAASEIESG